jgi:hypothetical protein
VLIFIIKLNFVFYKKSTESSTVAVLRNFSRKDITVYVMIYTFPMETEHQLYNYINFVETYNKLFFKVKQGLRPQAT